MTEIGAAELARVLGLPPPTEEQTAVIEAPLEPALVIAGAGSGKTETMAARVVWLVATGRVRPEQVLGLTFTRKAAGELAARIGHRLRQLTAARVVGPEVVLGGEPTVSTYHAYAARLVAEHGIRLGIEPAVRLLTPAVRWQLAARVVGAYDGDMSRCRYTPDTVVDHVLALAEELGEHFVDPSTLVDFTRRLDERVRARPDSARKKGIYAPVEAALERQWARLQLLPLVAGYEAAKRAGDVLDYGDQVGLAAQLARRFPEVAAAERTRFTAVLLDEYQDTSFGQLELLRRLYGDGQTVMAVGDPCQSIYGWRGASAGSLPRFPEQFPRTDGTLDPPPATVFELATSWRNDGRILALANRLSDPLRAAGARVPVLRPRAGREQEGEVICTLLPTAVDEAEWLADALAQRWAATPPPTVAVLTRRRAQQRVLEAALRARGLPVQVIGLGGLLDTPEVRDIVSTLRVAVDPSAGNALVRLLSGARWRLGARDLMALGRRAATLARSAAEPVTGPDRAPAGDAAEPGAVTAPTAGEGAASPGALPDPDVAGSIVDALDDPGPAAAYSAVGYDRMGRLREELRGLRRRLDQPLPDLLADVERTIGLDIEVAVRRPQEQALARGHLDAFLDIAADFAADLGRDGAGVLPAFLAYLSAAEDEERGLEAGVVERPVDAVQILTVHGAKGLEWDVVAVPGLVEGVFPSKDAGTEVWTSRLGMLPYPLRGDRADLPEFRADVALDNAGARDALERFKADCRDIGRAEERRLAYVAVTRARGEVLLSGYHWDEGVKPRALSEFLAEAHEFCAEGGGTVGEWAAPPDETVNPNRVTARTADWPIDPLGERRESVAAAAALVAEVSVAEVSDAEVPDPGETEWSADIALLLAERAGAEDDRDVVLPDHLSVSQLVALRRSAGRLAEQIRRPMPLPPAPLARRGTAFHRWLEQRYGAQRLLDLDDLPGAGDADADDRDLATLQASFLASPWAERTPVEVEVPFDLRVGDLLLRGRMDAVFRDADGRYEVVDWKTGAAPGPADARAAEVQLAAYRLAWSDLAGVPLDEVGAAFHYVRAGRTDRPADLLDAGGLRALVEGLPSV